MLVYNRGRQTAELIGHHIVVRLMNLSIFLRKENLPFSTKEHT